MLFRASACFPNYRFDAPFTSGPISVTKADAFKNPTRVPLSLLSYTPRYPPRSLSLFIRTPLPKDASAATFNSREKKIKVVEH